MNKIIFKEVEDALQKPDLGIKIQITDRRGLVYKKGPAPEVTYISIYTDDDDELVFTKGMIPEGMYTFDSSNIVIGEAVSYAVLKKLNPGTIKYTVNVTVDGYNKRYTGVTAWHIPVQDEYRYDFFNKAVGGGGGAGTGSAVSNPYGVQLKKGKTGSDFWKSMITSVDESQITEPMSMRQLYEGTNIITADLTKISDEVWGQCSMDGAFANSNVKKIKWRETDNKLGIQNFQYNKAVVNVTLPGIYTRIYDMFEGCTNLKSVTFTEGSITDGLRNIFKDCSSLEKVDFTGLMITALEDTGGDSVFEGCDNLTSVQFKPATERWIMEEIATGLNTLLYDWNVDYDNFIFTNIGKKSPWTVIDPSVPSDIIFKTNNNYSEFTDKGYIYVNKGGWYENYIWMNCAPTGTYTVTIENIGADIDAYILVPNTEADISTHLDNGQEYTFTFSQWSETSNEIRVCDSNDYSQSIQYKLKALSYIPDVVYIDNNFESIKGTYVTLRDTVESVDTTEDGTEYIVTMGNQWYTQRAVLRGVKTSDVTIEQGQKITVTGKVYKNTQFADDNPQYADMVELRFCKNAVIG